MTAWCAGSGQTAEHWQYWHSGGSCPVCGRHFKASLVGRFGRIRKHVATPNERIAR